MNPGIVARQTAIFTAERCFIRELVNSVQHPHASLAHCRVEPGVLTERHRLSVDEWYVLLSGRGEMSLGDATPFEVVAGDTLFIPAGTPQQIRNTGDDDLCFHCLCQPRFTPACYQGLES